VQCEICTTCYPKRKKPFDWLSFIIFIIN
jgi:hypothetical protein